MAKRPDAGFSLLEVVIAAAIIAVVLQTAASSTLLMTRSGEFGAGQTERSARARNVLEMLAAEIRSSSSDTDPATGDPYIAVDGAPGDERLTFRRVAQYGSNGAEVVAIWSTPIEVFRDEDRLVRRQDGVEQVIMNQVETVDFDLDSLGRVDVQVGTFTAPSSQSGTGIHLLHGVRATPQH